MTVHPMVPSDYTTPETIRALDDATRVGGALAGILAAVIAAGVAVRRWWHRKRDRQERVLRDAMSDLAKSLNDRLDAMHDDVTAIREAEVRHLEAHAEGRTS